MSCDSIHDHGPKLAYVARETIGGQVRCELWGDGWTTASKSMGRYIKKMAGKQWEIAHTLSKRRDTK